MKYSDYDKLEWLKRHCIGIKAGDMDGPDRPVLYFYWDIWDEDKFKWDIPYLDFESYLERAMDATI